ncbi:MAG: hypothetical protein JWQ19_1937 [Subtercola sp.]|nr:hypothetical protein [Subtercola sp.]
MALPAFAFSTTGAFDPASSGRALAAGQQSLQSDANAAVAPVGRDEYLAPTEEDLAAARAKAAAEAAAAAAAAAAQAAALRVTTVTSAAASGASTPVAVNPPSGPYSGQAVVDYAMQFVGKVPYGAGASPDTSFGCDGLTQYVFGQFGISLPRTVSRQAALGTRIAPEDAQPGDLMIYPIGHVGIYAGVDSTTGRQMMIHSPDWGRCVEYDPVWGSYYFVRLGI